MMYIIKHRQTGEMVAIAHASQIIICQAAIKSTLVQGGVSHQEVFVVAGNPFPTVDFHAEPIGELPARLTERGN